MRRSVLHHPRVAMPRASASASCAIRTKHEPPSPGRRRPVHYVVRPDNAPSNGAHTLTATIATVSQATGCATSTTVARPKVPPKIARRTSRLTTEIAGLPS